MFQNGLDWSTPEPLPCDFVPTGGGVGGDNIYKARYIRVFVAEDPDLSPIWAPIYAMFVPFGYDVNDYTPFNVLYTPTPCTGYQVGVTKKGGTNKLFYECRELINDSITVQIREQISFRSSSVFDFDF